MPGEPSFFEIGVHDANPGRASYAALFGWELGVRELGGSAEELDVDGGEENVARFGSFKLCRDDQGSPFGLHQPPGR